MPINYNQLDEGDKLDADSLNDRFDTLGGAGQGVNNLGQEDLERHALRVAHTPSLITNGDFPNGLGKIGPLGYPGVETYETTLNPGVVGVPAGYLTTFGAVAPNAPYGPVVGDTGWRIPATGNVVADAAEITFPAITATTAFIGDYKGFLVRLGIALDGIDPSDDNQDPHSPSVVIGIGWTDDVGTRRVIDRSIRWCHIQNRVKGSLDTFTFIKQEDIGTGVGIQSVFGVIAGANKNRAVATSPAPQITFYNLSLIPIRSGELD